MANHLAGIVVDGKYSNDLRLQLERSCDALARSAPNTEMRGRTLSDPIFRAAATGDGRLRFSGPERSHARSGSTAVELGILSDFSRATHCEPGRFCAPKSPSPKLDNPERQNKFRS